MQANATRANYRCKRLEHRETVFCRNRQHGFGAPERVFHGLNRPIAEEQSEREYTLVGVAELVRLSESFGISRAGLIRVAKVGQRATRACRAFRASPLSAALPPSLVSERSALAASRERWRAKRPTPVPSDLSMPTAMYE
jgi:hypothetical protein